MTQFVPLKLDTSSKEFRGWSQEHQSEGNSIPILYVVRADGETLYGQSGSLLGDRLPAMLLQSLRHSGRVLTPKESEAALEAIGQFDEFYSKGEIRSAIKALNKVKRLGIPGEIESYAAPVVKINAAARKLAEEVDTKMKQQLIDVQSGDEQRQLSGLLESLQMKRDYSSLRSAKTKLTEFSHELGKLKSIKQLIKEARIIDAARIAKSRSSINRGIAKLTALKDSTTSETVKKSATDLLRTLQDKLDNQ